MENSADLRSKSYDKGSAHISMIRNSKTHLVFSSFSSIGSFNIHDEHVHIISLGHPDTFECS